MDVDNPQFDHGLEKYLSLLESVLSTFVERGPFKFSFSIRKAAVRPDDPEGPEYIVDLSGPDASPALQNWGL